MKRVLLILAVAAVIAATTAGSVMPTFAQLNPGGVLNLVNSLLGGLLGGGL